ncbi:MAG: hypothetical protein AAI946_00865 [Candidatus Hodgkinia cicadicola]
MYGIQPSGYAHLGNLLCIQLARTARAQKWVCCIADLHALTSNASNLEYKTRVRLTTAFVLASIPNSVCIVYVQSRSLAQACLLWIISCLSRLPELARASAAADGANVARVLYPGLMAADVIACRATHVVVGYDQRKHLEYIRLISRRINALARVVLSTQHSLLPALAQCFQQPVKLMSLQAPAAKMSKSSACELSSVCILDDYTSIQTKIAHARTDNCSRLPASALGLNNRSGLANLIEAYALIARLSPQALLNRISALEVKRFKRWLARLIHIKMRTPRMLTKRWLRKPEALDAILTAGSALIIHWSSSCVNHIKLITELAQCLR